MTAWLISLYTVVVVSELVGVWLLIKEASKARTLLTTYTAANPNGKAGGSYEQVANLQPVILAVLGNQAVRGHAVALIVLGIVTGAAGNFLSI